MPRGRPARPPANPAPQHNLPGALAKRSDGGPSTQLPFNAVGHGDRQDFEAFQAASGSPPGGAAGPSGAASPPGGPAGMPPELSDVFAPAQQGDRPASTRTPPANIPDDPDMLLRVMYSQFPHPDLLRLIQRRTGL